MKKWFYFVEFKILAIYLVLLAGWIYLTECVKDKPFEKLKDEIV
jgi:hypothetical protein